MTETAPPPSRRLTPGSPAGQVVLAYLREQAAALDRLDPGVRRDQPDAVHQMRVATRRLRSTLRTFRRVIGPAGDLDDELRWLAGVLGEARDAEVLAGHLESALRAVPKEELIGPVQARIKVHFAPVAAQAREGVLEALDSRRYGSLRDRVGKLIAGPLRPARAGGPAGEVLPAEVRRAYRTTARRMERARQAPPGPARDTALHQARKAAKRARYAGELARPAIGRKAERFTRQVKEVQTLLGDHHDAVIARQRERSLGIEAHLSGENAFTYGLLYERESEAADKLGARAFKAWKKASRPRFRRWMS
ncbi:MAG TPA: CHAD domain-containing protein [Streptosporangiaceae bacterium]|nr:CHAD domain-containing protein [Streptosporangiaceae bacterium]